MHYAHYTSKSLAKYISLLSFPLYVSSVCCHIVHISSRQCSQQCQQCCKNRNSSGKNGEREHLEKKVSEHRNKYRIMLGAAPRQGAQLK